MTARRPLRLGSCAPSVSADVFNPRTNPKVVMRPSLLFVIASVAMPMDVALVAEASAFAIATVVRVPVDPTTYTAAPSVTVTPLVLRA